MLLEARTLAAGYARICFKKNDEKLAKNHKTSTSESSFHKPFKPSVRMNFL
jgi:hypothetical protein